MASRRTRSSRGFAIGAALWRAALDVGAGVAGVFLVAVPWALWEGAVEALRTSVAEALGMAVLAGFVSLIALMGVYGTVGGRFEALLVEILTGRRGDSAARVGTAAAGIVLVALGVAGTANGLAGQAIGRAYLGIGLVLVGVVLLMATVAGWLSPYWIAAEVRHDRGGAQAPRRTAAEMTAVFVSLAVVALASSGGIASGIALVRGGWTWW